MFGARLKDKPYYRCKLLRPDYADTGHPSHHGVREERVLTALDRWLSPLTDAEHRDATVAAVLAADAGRDPEPTGDPGWHGKRAWSSPPSSTGCSRRSVPG